LVRCGLILGPCNVGSRRGHATMAELLEACRAVTADAGRAPGAWMSSLAGPPPLRAGGPAPGLSPDRERAALRARVRSCGE
jgi:hypothetical protein